MKNNKLLILSLIAGIALVSCGTNNTDSTTNGKKTYTVIWQNYNGDILEIDKNVKVGTTPTYDGVTPTLSSNEQYSYKFVKWDPEINEVNSHITYTAVFEASTNSYTVTWKNYNGDILEVDNNVLYGTIPTYNGNTPIKENNGNYSYSFKGWDNNIIPIKQNITYTATFKEIDNGGQPPIEGNPGIDPVFTKDGKTVQYGFYPQTHVNDASLVEILNTLQASDINGWYLYNGEYYVKSIATIFNNESYTFNDKTSIVTGSEYWYKCEPITWNVLSKDNQTYFLLSEMLLDAHNYYKDYDDRVINSKTIYANNYEYSDIRNYLNNDFYNQAFALNSFYVQEVTVNNAAATTDNSKSTYACNNTLDKVYLPSYQDYLTLNYGFDNNPDNPSITRECKTTDYVRSLGAWCNTRTDLGTNGLYNGTYWTRSPSSEYYYSAWNVNSGGYLSKYAVDGTSHCIRPCITIKL